MTPIVLGVIALALVVLIAWREHEHRAQLSEFADRLQAPEAANIAAVERAMAPREPIVLPDPYDELVASSPDVSLEDLLAP
jgi:hypothetical protein